MSNGDTRPDETWVGDALAAILDLRGSATIAAVLIATGAAAFALVSGNAAKPLLLTLMSVLAVFGLFSILAYLAGHIRLGERLPGQHLATLIADGLDDAVQLTAASGSVMWSNKRSRDFLGRSSLGGLHSLETALGAAPHISEALFRLERASEQGQARIEDIAVTLPAGTLGAQQPVAAVRVSVTPFAVKGHDRDAGPFSLWRIVDITSERRRQESLVAELNQTLATYDAMPVGLLATDALGNVTHLNASFLSWLGFASREEANERCLKLTDLVSSDCAELLIAMTNNSAQVPASTDIDLIKENGQLLPVRVVCQRATGQEQGALVLAALTRDDDTADERADNNGRRFARFFRSAPFGIATVGKDGNIASSNAAFSRMIVDGTRGIGDSAAKVLSRSVSDETRTAVAEGLDKVLAGQGNVSPVDIEAGANGEFARRIYMNALTNTKDSPEAAILYVIDVTEQKALEAKFAQSQKMDAVGKLAGFVAHDFNNMLTAIIGFSDFLLQTHRPTDPAYSDIINIKSSAARAAGLVGKLLALARQQTLLVEPLQLGEVMTDLAPLLKRSIGERIELKLSTGRDLWFVRTDKLQLEQAVINLAVNARDAMEDGGRLHIRTRNVTERESQRLQHPGMDVGEYVLLEVEDTGTGMAPDMLQKIFEPFFTTKAPGKGTGLGLATVYGIVKQTGGFIFPDSTLGRGTTFRIYLPRHHLDDKEDAVLTEKAEAKKQHQSADLTGAGRVLLVEDEDVVRSFAVRALTRQGYEVLEAGDGLEALDVLEKCGGDVDIVVSDVVMPEMDGPTMLKEMRKKNPDIKIIFVSGYPNEAFQQALGEETFAFLPKPFSLPQLAAKVKAELGE